MSIKFRLATDSDASLLAVLNQQLIQDEGHRNRMALPELEERMTKWLSGNYEAAVFELSGAAVGYALFRWEESSVYLRQFFVGRESRRQGIGRAAIAWLRCEVWQDAERIRLDVLCGNAVGIKFWQAIGFEDYCLTMELEQRSSHE